MADDYAFPQAMCRGLGAVPQGVGAGGGAPSEAQPSHARTVMAPWRFDPFFVCWYSKTKPPAASPQDGAGMWIYVKRPADPYKPGFPSPAYPSILPCWIWYPLPGQILSIGPKGSGGVSNAVFHAVPSPGKAPPILQGDWRENFPNYWVDQLQGVPGPDPGAVIPTP